ncbi:MAG: SH3 domain-containing protein [Chloroflexi bacterium]|nr:SH3 domain-containing protein [Chloroflexota bacterium]
MMRPDGAPGESGAEAEAWLRQLRDGAPPQKAEARWQLAAIFARRGLTEQAVELLVTNAQAGYRSPKLFETLARHYRTLGNEYLAASASLEAARLRERGGQPAGQASGGRAGAGGAAGDGDQARAGPGSGSGHEAYARQGRQPSGGTGRRADTPASGIAGGELPGNGLSWERPLRVAGWVACVGLFLAAMAVGQRSPASAVVYMLAAAALGLLLAGAPGLRRLLHVPSGALGNGLLLFVGALLFLTGGALLPRESTPFVSPSAPASGPTPRIPPTPTDPPLVPTARPSIAPTAGPAASPSPAAQAAPAGSDRSAASGAPAALATSGPQEVVVPASPPPAPPAPAAVAAVDRGEATHDLAAGAHVQVVGAGSEGVRLRPEPGSETVIRVLADGMHLEALGERHQDGGRLWQQVRLPNGDEGWIAANFLMVVTATPRVASAPAPAPTRAATPTVTVLARAPTTAAAPRSQAPRGAPLGMDCPAGLPIKGNHSSSGEWIYHRPGGQFYRQTRPEQCFATEADARAAGYRASLR